MSLKKNVFLAQVGVSASCIDFSDPKLKFHRTLKELQEILLKTINAVISDTSIPPSFLQKSTNIKFSGGFRGWGARDARSPLAQNVFIFMQFSGKIGQIIGWRPLWGWHPWEILDPPLKSLAASILKIIIREYRATTAE